MCQLKYVMLCEGDKIQIALCAKVIMERMKENMINLFKQREVTTQHITS